MQSYTTALIKVKSWRIIRNKVSLETKCSLSSMQDQIRYTLTLLEIIQDAGCTYSKSLALFLESYKFINLYICLKALPFYEFVHFLSTLLSDGKPS